MIGLLVGLILGLTMSTPPVPAAGVGAPLQAVRGTASWYDVGDGLYAAAGPSLRVGDWRGRVVHVSASDRAVTVRLVDWCACPKRVIDLSHDAFARLDDPSRGLVTVVVSWGGGELPATDALP